jgi:dynein light chain roadblock-type
MGDVALVEETVKRLSSYKGVVGVLIVNGEGIPVRSTMENDMSVQFGAMAAQLARQARGLVREAAPEDELEFVRLRSKRREVMIAPCYDKEQRLSLVVVQDPSGPDQP